MKTKIFLAAFLCLGLPGLFVYSQASREGTPGSSQNPGGVTMSADVTGKELPLRRISLLSSGVGYFEHSGTLYGQSEIILPFDAAAVNDALKSLVVNDPASVSPSVRYASENTLYRTLKSLKIDLSGTPGIAEILNGLKGAALEISAPNAITGRIIGVEYRDQNISPSGETSREAWLSLFTSSGIKAVAVKNIASFRFTDEQINADLNRALDLIMASRDEEARNLLLTLDGSSNREVHVSYVIPSPVWKVSYRLDLGGNSPFLQGWAIVDNDSDTDWKEVELSLLTGRPVSFIQNLYPPLRLFRPTLPLSIAGIAESQTYEPGYGGAGFAEAPAQEKTMRQSRRLSEYMAEESVSYDMAASAAAVPAPAAPVLAKGNAAAASARAAGDQFEFTLKNPVSLERRQSAMLPLVEGTVKAEKTLVFSGARALAGETIHPAISAELTNTSGMKLPAGPITVYDGGTYAGDALIEFFPENEKRLISYGDDLSVTGNLTSSGIRYITGVSIVNGVMTVSRRQTYEKEYTIRNGSEEAKKIIIEHPIAANSELAEPKSAEDRTANLYRFSRNLPAKDLLSFKVREETPLSERIVLGQLKPEAFAGYLSNREIPENVRAVFARAVELKKKADDAANAQSGLESQRVRLVQEQDRIRRNLEAAGNNSPQGQEYLKRLASLDGDIDNITLRIDNAAKETLSAKRDYENYLSTVSL